MKHLVSCAAAVALIVSPVMAKPRHVMTDHKRILVLQELVYQLRMQAKAAADAPTFLKHAWPSLTGEEKDALSEVLRTVPKGTKFDIVCNDASCSELASDIDDCMEKAGLESGLDHSVSPLGYGIALQVNAYDQDKAELATGALKKATEGRMDVHVLIAKPGANPPGYVTILIGKRPQH